MKHIIIPILQITEFQAWKNLSQEDFVPWE